MIFIHTTALIETRVRNLGAPCGSPHLWAQPLAPVEFLRGGSAATDSGVIGNHPKISLKPYPREFFLAVPSSLRLRSRGHEVIGRNVRTPVGEMDILSREGRALVVTEVKARAGQEFGDALESVGYSKVSRLRAAAAWWTAHHADGPCEVRFDVITVALGRHGGLLSLVHMRDIDGEG